MVPKFQEGWEVELASAREWFANGDYVVGMTIKKCKTYPVAGL
jgi:hypothetical protein